jgi:hypothetical protein
MIDICEVRNKTNNAEYRFVTNFELSNPEIIEFLKEKIKQSIKDLKWWAQVTSQELLKVKGIDVRNSQLIQDTAKYLRLKGFNTGSFESRSYSTPLIFDWYYREPSIETYIRNLIEEEVESK